MRVLGAYYCVTGLSVFVEVRSDTVRYILRELSSQNNVANPTAEDIEYILRTVPTDVQKAWDQNIVNDANRHFVRKFPYPYESSLYKRPIYDVQDLIDTRMYMSYSFPCTAGSSGRVVVSYHSLASLSFTARTEATISEKTHPRTSEGGSRRATGGLARADECTTTTTPCLAPLPLLLPLSPLFHPAPSPRRTFLFSEHGRLGTVPLLIFPFPFRPPASQTDCDAYMAHSAAIAKVDPDVGRHVVSSIPIEALGPAKLLVEMAVEIAGNYAVVRSRAFHLPYQLYWKALSILTRARFVRFFGWGGGNWRERDTAEQGPSWPRFSRRRV